MDKPEAPLPNILQLTPLDPAYREDPYAVLADLRQRCPVHRDEMAGLFMLTRYEDVRALVSDLTLWRDPLLAEEAAVFTRRFAEGSLKGERRSETTSILMLDNPDHARIRQPLAQALYARVARARPLVEAIVESTLDDIEKDLGQGGAFDLMSRFCIPVPIDAIATILGVDHARLGQFRDWSEGIIQALNPFRNAEQTAHMERSSVALTDYFTQLMAERRADPRDDLISDMVVQQSQGADLSDTELRINLSALLIGGNLTTTDLIGNAVRLLLLNPAELAKFKADPKIANTLVEETLRFEPPVDATSRVANRDFQVGGCPIHASQVVNVSLRGANRDPEAFADPDRFDVTRKGKPHVAFGGGAHICIGAPLARLEAQVALSGLFRRFPDLAFADPAAEPQWRKLPFFRGLERLDLKARA